MDKTDEARLGFTIEDRFVPDHFSVERLYENEGEDPTDYEYDYGLSLSNVTNRMGVGHSVVTMAGHGSKTGIYRRVWTNDADGDGLDDKGSEEADYQYFNTGQNPSNGKKMPLVYLDACSNGHFDHTSDCLAEHIIKNIGIGAVASSRISWYNVAWDPGADGGRSNQGHAYRFWEQFFAGYYSPGAALYESKKDYVDDEGLDIYNVKNLFNYNLLGDPEVLVWTAIPENFTVDHPGNISSNEETLQIAVFDSEASPVEDAVVTIMNDDIYQTGLTDSDGEIVFNFEQDINSSLLLTVTAHNFLFFRDTINALYPPVIRDLGVSTDSVYRSKTMFIYINGTDDKNAESELDCVVEFRAPTGDWTVIPDVYYDSDDSLWVAEFLLGTDFELGSYDFRVKLIDKDGCESRWTETLNTTEVHNIIPVPMSLSSSSLSVIRTSTSTIYANGSDMEDDESELNCRFQYMAPSGSWSELGACTFVDGSWEVSFSPGSGVELGMYDFRVRFTDTDGGEDNWLERSELVEVLNKAPAPTIDGISPNPVNEGKNAWFYGNGTDDDGTVEEYEWCSSIVGGVLNHERAFSLSSLPNGTHTIYFRVKDNNSLWSEDTSTTLVVNGIPWAHIGGIDPGITIENETIRFSGLGNDDGNISCYLWHSSIDGTLYNGSNANFTLSNLSLGTHTIFLRVRDDYGTWSVEVNTTLIIHRKAQAMIKEIEPNPALDSDTLLFTGNGTDDGTIEGYHWRVLDETAGEVHNDSAPPVMLPAGLYTVYLKVQDNHGVWSEEVSRTLVVHEKPHALIDVIYPSPALPDDSVSFNGSGRDDGELVRFAWRSSIDSEIYNGSATSFTRSNLSLGNHSIYFKAMDNYGIWSEEVSTSLTIHQKPTAEIELILPGVVLAGEDVRFTAWGTDDGTIEQYAWRSNLDDEFYNGSETECNCSHLSLGAHTISLKVKDNYGAWSDEVQGTLTVHRRPTAGITSVSPNPAREGESIRFSGAGTDDGIIARYAWRSSIDGELYNNTGTIFNYAALSTGTHNITLKVQDDHGAWSDAAFVSVKIGTEKPEDEDEKKELYHLLFQEIGPLPVFVYAAIALMVAAFGVGVARRGKKGDDKELKSPQAVSFQPRQTSQVFRPPQAHQVKEQARKPSPPHELGGPAGAWSCPACGKQVDRKFIFCVFCGNKRV